MPRITLQYSGPTAQDLELLQIEQSPWSAYTGVVTKAGMVLTLREMLYGEDAGSVVDCGFVDGNLVCLIDVYPRQPGLSYQFSASYGELSPRREETVHLTETINFSLESSVTPEHPPLAINHAAWIDAVYDSEGNDIAPPQLTIIGGSIASPLPVYGAVEVEYTTERHSYILTIPRREDAVDHFYTAAVFGWYAGGVDWLEMELPPGIETFDADPEAVCGRSDSGSVIDPDDPDYTPPVSASRLTIVDYCTQEVLEDSAG